MVQVSQVKRLSSSEKEADYLLGITNFVDKTNSVKKGMKFYTENEDG